MSPFMSTLTPTTTTTGHHDHLLIQHEQFLCHRECSLRDLSYRPVGFCAFRCSDAPDAASGFQNDRRQDRSRGVERSMGVFLGRRALRVDVAPPGAFIHRSEDGLWGVGGQHRKRWDGPYRNACVAGRRRSSVTVMRTTIRCHGRSRTAGRGS